MTTTRTAVTIPRTPRACRRRGPSTRRQETAARDNRSIYTTICPGDNSLVKCSSLTTYSCQAHDDPCRGPNSSDGSILPEAHCGTHKSVFTSSSFPRNRSSRCSPSLICILPLLFLTISLQMVHGAVLSNPQEYEVEYGGGGGRAKVVVDQGRSTATITPPGAASPATLIDYHKGIVIYMLDEECLVGRLRTHHKQSWQKQKRQLQRAIGSNSQRISAIHHAVRQHSNPTLYVEDIIKPSLIRSVVGRRLYSWCTGKPTWRLSTRRPRLPTYSDYLRSYNQNLTMKQNSEDHHRRKRSSPSTKQASRRAARRNLTENGRRQRRRRHRSTGRKRHNKRGLGSNGNRDRTKRRRGRRHQKQSQANRLQQDAPVILDIPPSELPEENDPYPSANFIRSNKDVQKIKHYESFFQDTTSNPIIIETNNTGETIHLVNVTEKKPRKRNGSRSKPKPITIPNTIIRDGKVFYRHDVNAKKSENTGQNKRFTDLEDFVSDGGSYRPHASYESDTLRPANNGILNTQRTHRFSSGTNSAGSNTDPTSGWNRANGDNDRRVTNSHGNTQYIVDGNSRSSNFQPTVHTNPEYIVQGRTPNRNPNDIPHRPTTNAFDFYSGPSQAETQVVSVGGRSHATAGSTMGLGPVSSVEGSSGTGGHFSAQSQSIGSQGEITQTHVLGDVMGAQGSASNTGFGHETHAHVSMGNHPEVSSSHTNNQGMTISSKVQTSRHGGTVTATAHGPGHSNTESHLNFTPHDNRFQGRSTSGMSSGHGTASITSSSLGTASKASYEGEVQGGMFIGTAEAGMINGPTDDSRISNINANEFDISQNNMIMHEDTNHDRRIPSHTDSDSMIGSIMETIHTPDMDTRISSFPVTGESFTSEGFIDQGGLSGGSGIPPRESEIENIASLNNEELPEGGSSEGVSNDGIVGLATYSRGQFGSPPGPGEISGVDTSNNHDYLNVYLNNYGNDIYDSTMISGEQVPYIDLGPEIEGLKPLTDVPNDVQSHRQSLPQHQLPSNTDSDRLNFQSIDNGFNQSLIYIPDEEAIPHITSPFNQEHHSNVNRQNQWQEPNAGVQPYQPWEHDTSQSIQPQEYTNTYNNDNGYLPQTTNINSSQQQYPAVLQTDFQRESRQQRVHEEYQTEEELQLQRQWEEQHLGVRHDSIYEIPAHHDSISSSDIHLNADPIGSSIAGGALFPSTTAVPQTVQLNSLQQQTLHQNNQFNETNHHQEIQIHSQEVNEEHLLVKEDHSQVLGHILPQSRPTFPRTQNSNRETQTSISGASRGSSVDQQQKQNRLQSETNEFRNDTNNTRQRVGNSGSQDLGVGETLDPVGSVKPDVNVVFANNMEGEVDRSLLYQRPGKSLEPGEKIPGVPGYRVPAGFRGRVILGHNLPTQAQSRNVVQGFNTHVKLTPQNPHSNMPVFASVGGPEASKFLPGGENTQGLHVTLSGGGYQPKMQPSSSFSSSMSHSSLNNGMPQTSMPGMHNMPPFQHTINTNPSHSGSQQNHQSWIPMDMNKSWNGQNGNSLNNNNQNTGKSWNNGMMNGGKSWSNSWSRSSSWRQGNGGSRSNNRQSDGTCGYFVMSCNMVYGPYSQSEVCKPKQVSENCCC